MLCLGLPTWGLRMHVPSPSLAEDKLSEGRLLLTSGLWVYLVLASASLWPPGPSIFHPHQSSHPGKQHGRWWCTDWKREMKAFSLCFQGLHQGQADAKPQGLSWLQIPYQLGNLKETSECLIYSESISLLLSSPLLSCLSLPFLLSPPSLPLSLEMGTGWCQITQCPSSALNLSEQLLPASWRIKSKACAGTQDCPVRSAQTAAVCPLLFYMPQN